MAKLEQLKAEARRHEAKGDRRRALHLYERAIRQMQKSDEVLSDPRLFLRVADLAYEQGDREAAVEHYEEAAAEYAEQGLINNAIAVWTRVVELFPSYVDCHRRLAHLFLDLNLQLEARKRLRTYVDVLRDKDDVERAVAGVEGYLERVDDPEARELLASLRSPTEGADASEEDGESETERDEPEGVPTGQTEGAGPGHGRRSEG